jgi:predicted ester cyclase
MTAEDNKALVRRYLDEVWDKGNMAFFDEVLAPDYRRHVAPEGMPLTPDGQRQRVASFRAAFPDIHCTLEEMIAEGEQVAFRLTFRGTHTGPLLGLAPTGKTVAFTALDTLRIRGGRFVEHWGGPDFYNLLQQLGARLEAPPA